MAKRFNKQAVAFMKACLELQLAQIASLKDSAKAKFARFPRIILLDSTQWQLKKELKKWFRGYGGGASKAACKLQTAIDAVSGTILLFDYHSATRPDQGYGKKILGHLRPGDLLLMDLGYYSVKLFRQIHKLGSFFICPVYHHSSIKEIGPKKNTFPLADFLGKSKADMLDCLLWIGTKEKMILRLVAVRNPPEKAAKLRRKIREDYRRQRSGQPPQKRLQFCDWTVLITNIPSSEIPTQDVVNAYRCRWQIEIFFRDAKSHLRLNAAPTKTRERFEVQLLAVLILAALLCFIQGRFNANAHQELSLDKLIKRFAEHAASIRDCLLQQSFWLLPKILEKLLKHSIKFHQPSRETPRQIIKKACA